MSEMVERVARAIHSANAETEGLRYSDLLQEMARRAIAAMREPTYAMFEAGDWNAGATLSEGDPDRAERVYRAMIDAALAQPSA